MMLGVSWGTWIIFAIGVLLGWLLGSKEGRVKFFKGLREFIGKTGKQAQHVNREQEEFLRRAHKGLGGKPINRRSRRNEDDDDEDPIARI